MSKVTHIAQQLSYVFESRSGHEYFLPWSWPKVLVLLGFARENKLNVVHFVLARWALASIAKAVLLGHILSSLCPL